MSIFRNTVRSTVVTTHQTIGSTDRQLIPYASVILAS